MCAITVSFVIIEYNSIDEIVSCVSSIQSACKTIPHEIIVSSNSCYAPEVQAVLMAKYSSLSWSFNLKNGGFAYAMNQGLAMARGKYLAIVNPDVKIKEGIGEMVRFMDEHPSVGAIAPKIVNERGETQDSARPYVSIQSFISRTLKRLCLHTVAVLSSNMNYAKIQTVDWVIGAFIMVRNEVYRKTGGLDNCYFMYAEDLDWCTRIRQCGYEVVYYPLAQIVYEGSRAARKKLKYTRIFLKSHLHYWRKFGFLFGYPRRNHIVFQEEKDTFC